MSFNTRPGLTTMKIPVNAPKLCNHLDESVLKASPNPETPVLDIRNGVTQKDVEEHLLKFIRWFYQAPELTVTMDFLEEIEKQYYARVDGVDVESVEYGRIFIKKDGTGGIPDRGFTCYFCLNDLLVTMGLDIKNLSSNKQTHGITEEIIESSNIEIMQANFCKLLARLGLLLDEQSGDN